MQYFIVFFSFESMQWVAAQKRGDNADAVQVWTDKEQAIRELATLRLAGFNAKLAVMLDD